MTENEQAIIDLLAPLITRTKEKIQIEKERQKRDRLYITIHQYQSSFISHSAFVKIYKKVGWEGYIFHFALTKPRDLIRIYRNEFTVDEFDLLEKKVFHLRSIPSEYAISIIEKAMAYYNDLKKEKRTDRRFQQSLRKYPAAYGARKYAYTPQMIHDYYCQLRDQDEFYRHKPEELFNLAQLDYRDYLNSPFWYVIRSTVLFRDNYKCQLCGEPADTVHHHSYEPIVLYGMDLKQLVAICDECHKTVEFDNGQKVHDIDKKRLRYDALRGEYLQKSRS